MHPYRIATIGMMAKYWQSGKVKTRLGASIGMDRSAQLHQVLVHHLVRHLSPIQDRALLQWVLAPAHRHAAAQQQLDDWDALGWQIVLQGEGDLGDRMQRWFRTTLESGANHSDTHRRAILIGADCPHLTPDDLDATIGRLDDTDVVLGPTVDGGYYLIGLRPPWRDSMQRLFADIKWSQHDVFKITCRRIQEAGLTVSILPQREDIDTIDELVNLQKSLRLPSNRQDPAMTRLGNAIEAVLSTDPRQHP